MKRDMPVSMQQLISCIVMILALLWLTVSIPFVFSAQQKIATEDFAKKGQTIPKKNSTNNPFANTTEEKTPNGPNTLSEYLHDIHSNEQPLIVITQTAHYSEVDTYLAYHGELTGPPPKL